MYNPEDSSVPQTPTHENNPERRASGETQDETRLLHLTSQHINAAMDVDGVVRAYLEQVAALGRYACNVALYQFDDEGERCGVIVRGRWTPDEGIGQQVRRYEYTYDALDPILDRGETVRISDVMTDPRVTDTLRDYQRARPALVMIPLIVHGLRVGLVILSYHETHAWNDAELHPYQITAALLGNSIVNRQQQHLLMEHDRQTAIMVERQRLARELHDSVTQTLFSMTLIAQSIAPAWERSPDEGQQRTDRLIELSQIALREMRALLGEMRPSQMDAPEWSAQVAQPMIVRLRQQGLIDVLAQHVSDLSLEGLQIDLDTECYQRQPYLVEEALFRIAQEALNNILKYAHHPAVTLQLDSTGEAISLTISDQGVGFDIAGVQTRLRESGSGLGLKMMRERAEALGGNLRLTTAPGAGTTVQVTLPKR
jgi:signal transduction histidine kinase